MTKRKRDTPESRSKERSGQDRSIGSIQDLIGLSRGLHIETRHRWIFRGQVDANWDLLPTAHRSYGQEEERYLTQEFRARAGLRHPRSPRYEDYADWLALMQHYGLPTRLLDWTHSPLTAAFFAVQNTMRHSDKRNDQPIDAVIWALCPGALNVAQRLGPYIHPLSSWPLHELVQSAFFQMKPKPQVAAAMAIETDVRMQVQRGAFTIHESRTPLNRMSGHQRWLRKFVIPAQSVRALADEVEFLGVGLADLFPDLGSLAKDIASLVPRLPASKPAS